MSSPRSLFVRAACAAFSLGVVLPLAVHAAQSKEKVLIDFALFPREGAVASSILPPYEYAFGSWEKKISDLRGRGTLVKAPSGKGGIGENKTVVEFGKSSAVELQFVIGNDNKAGVMSFSMEDKDGSEGTWTIPLAGKPVGQPLRHAIDLTKPEKDTKPGKTAGLNLKKINTWQIKGDYTDPKVEVLLVKLAESP